MGNQLDYQFNDVGMQEAYEEVRSMIYQCWYKNKDKPAFKKLGDQDYLQELHLIFYKAYQLFDKGKGVKFSTYLFQALQNLSITTSNKPQTQDLFIEDIQAQAGDSMYKREEKPEGSNRSIEAFDIIMEAVKVDDYLYQIMYRYLVLKETNSTIAKALNKTAPTINSYMNKRIKHLKEPMEQFIRAEIDEPALLDKCKRLVAYLSKPSRQSSPRQSPVTSISHSA